MKIKFIKEATELPEDIKEAQEELDKIIEVKSEKSPEYYAMMEKYKKSLTKINKECYKNPWEYAFGLDHLVEFLRFMRDYYALGENVWAEEDKEWVKGVKYTRLETLEQTLYYYDKWQHIDEEYVKVIKHPETYKEHDNGDGTFTVDDFGYHCEYKYGSAKRTYRKIYKEKKKYKKLFFKHLYTYIESWWD